jgi:hypothetical protein
MSYFQKISHILWNPKTRYHVHKSQKLVPIQTKMNPFHIVTRCFSVIHFYIILPSTHWASKWSSPFMFFDQNVVVWPMRPSPPPCLPVILVANNTFQSTYLIDVGLVLPHSCLFIRKCCDIMVGCRNSGAGRKTVAR